MRQRCPACHARATSAASASAAAGSIRRPPTSLCRLENFGNTCYCNSVLQTLYFCRPFRWGGSGLCCVAPALQAWMGAERLPGRLQMPRSAGCLCPSQSPLLTLHVLVTQNALHQGACAGVRRAPAGRRRRLQAAAAGEHAELPGGALPAGAVQCTQTCWQGFCTLWGGGLATAGWGKFRSKGLSSCMCGS